MKKSLTAPFIYPNWFKTLGLIMILLAILIFVYRITQYDILDLNATSFPIGMGLTFIFFAKEKVFDERIAYLKFKSLAVAVPASATLVMLINYTKNFSGYSIEMDSWYSISAFEYQTIAMVFAIGWFYYLRLKE